MERHNGIEPDPEGAFVYYADAQAMVEALQAQLVTLKRHAGLDCGDQSCLYALEHSGMRTNGGCRCSPKRMKDDLERSRKAVEALQRERDHAKKMEAVQKELADNQTWHVRELRAALDAEREKVAELEAAANYYKQPSKNGGVYSVSGGHIGNLMDWCKDNLKHCKFSGPDLDLDLVQTAQQIPQLKTELSQLKALVRAYCEAKVTFDDGRLREDHHAWKERFERLTTAEQALIATLPATPTERGEDHSGDDTDMVQKGGDVE